MPQGWIIMFLIMMLESFISSELLCKQKLVGWITGTVFFSNFVSGLFGIIITMILNGGWWMVVWFPWVGSHEVDFSIQNVLIGFIIYCKTFLNSRPFHARFSTLRSYNNKTNKIVL